MTSASSLLGMNVRLRIACRRAVFTALGQVANVHAGGGKGVVFTKIQEKDQLVLEKCIAKALRPIRSWLKRNVAMASWYKVTLSAEDILAGKRFSLLEAFEDLFMATGIPADAAIFTTSIVVSPQLFLFSPGAARIAKVLIEAYSGIECAAPMAADLELLVGHRGSERIPFASMLTQDSERRVYPRLPAPKGTIVAWHSSNKRLVCTVDNFGLGGLFIRTPSPPATGTFIQLLLDAPTGEVRARAAVQRSSPKQGMGVKFVAMDQEDRARFAGWLKTLSP